METSELKWYNKPVFIYVLSFFFFPVGLYLLWKSKIIIKRNKIIVSCLSGIMIVFAGIEGVKEENLKSKILSNSIIIIKYKIDDKDVAVKNVILYFKFHNSKIVDFQSNSESFRHIQYHDAKSDVDIDPRFTEFVDFDNDLKLETPLNADNPNSSAVNVKFWKNKLDISFVNLSDFKYPRDSIKGNITFSTAMPEGHPDWVESYYATIFLNLNPDSVVHFETLIKPTQNNTVVINPKNNLKEQFEKRYPGYAARYKVRWDTIEGDMIQNSVIPENGVIEASFVIANDSVNGLGRVRFIADYKNGIWGGSRYDFITLNSDTISRFIDKQLWSKILDNFNKTVKDLSGYKFYACEDTNGAKYYFNNGTKKWDFDRNGNVIGSNEQLGDN